MQDRGTKHQILVLLKKKGMLTAAELAEQIGITTMGIRQHLTVLERDGLVTFQAVRQQVGRPTYVYRLMPKADAFFPHEYESLVLDLLDDLSEMGAEETIEAFFHRQMERHKARYQKRLDHTGLEEKLKNLATLRDEDGYMAEYTQAVDGRLRLIQHHCPIYGVAEKHPQACKYELELFSQTLGVPLVREEHKVQGDARCTFRVHIRKSSRKK